MYSIYIEFQNPGATGFTYGKSVTCSKTVVASRYNRFSFLDLIILPFENSNTFISLKSLFASLEKLEYTTSILLKLNFNS